MRIILLSGLFYDKYRHCSEILEKENRPYACLEVIIDGQQFAIPIRHHLNHAYGFKTVGDSGLDYSKAVLIESQDYISSVPGRIDSHEWSLIKKNENIIYSQFARYLRQYKRALRHPDNPRSQMLMKYSSLQYFSIKATAAGK